ncbi:glycerophosphodiester phosphodiesterase family protein [Bifidobacterium kimbladii]|uniref:Glycerophosphoryl diester phosphodiesterase n=1 Tax=Bifidobacterium asteroides TaxID=1684 RepID=A0A0F4KTI0_9BIFI|nr:glycerophosphodiester phosphodiesterase family protein [Bifidobacterium asteroides]KJY49383.1 Glycerophosphoryl diester phosphodiesterase [Bifidobacterium asteroides]
MGSKARLAGKVALGLGFGVLGGWCWALAPGLSVVAGRRKPVGLSLHPYAHRGLHDAGSGMETANPNPGQTAYLHRIHDCLEVESDRPSGRHASAQAKPPRVVAPENSLAAFEAACRAGYGIELDVHLSRDGQVVVIHDGDLQRMAGVNRAVADLTYEQLQRIPLCPSPAQALESGEGIPGSADHDGGPETEGGDGGLNDPEAQHVPLLSEVLALVDGRVPLVIEIKMDRGLDQELMRRTDALLSRYQGPYVIESFNVLALAWYRVHHPGVTRGQLVVPYHGRVDSRSSALRWMAGSLLFNWLGRPDFVACEWHSGHSLPMRLYRFLGGTPIAWTVRSEHAQEEASPDFDGIIFESYLPES